MTTAARILRSPSQSPGGRAPPLPSVDAVEQLIRGLSEQGRTALVAMRQGERIGEVWLDRGRILCSDDLGVAATALAELLSWPPSELTVVPGARRTGACVALPAKVVLERARAVARERKTALAGVPRPTSLVVASKDARPRESDPSEARVLSALGGETKTPFELVGISSALEANGAALARLIARGAVVEVGLETASTALGERLPETAPGTRKSMLSGPATHRAGARVTLDEPFARGASMPGVRTLGASGPLMRPSLSGPAATTLPRMPSPAVSLTTTAHRTMPTEAWTTLAWDRDRPAPAIDASTMVARMRTVLEIEREAEPTVAAFADALTQFVEAGLDGVGDVPTAALALRGALDGHVTTADAVAHVESDELLARRILRAGSAAAYGRPAAAVDVAVRRIGLARAYRIACTSLLDRGLMHDVPRRLAGPRVACTLAGELAVTLAPRGLEEKAYLAGLLHAAGRLVLAALAHRVARGLAGDRLEGLLATYQTSVGALLAHRWQLGDEVIEAVAMHPDALLPEASPSPLTRVTRLAQIVATGLTEDPPVPDWRIGRALAAAGVDDAPAVLKRGRELLHELRF